jgi:hypothetical protein
MSPATNGKTWFVAPPASAGHRVVLAMVRRVLGMGLVSRASFQQFRTNPGTVAAPA